MKEARRWRRRVEGKLLSLVSDWRVERALGLAIRAFERERVMECAVGAWRR